MKMCDVRLMRNVYIVILLDIGITLFLNKIHLEIEPLIIIYSKTYRAVGPE